MIERYFTDPDEAAGGGGSNSTSSGGSKSSYGNSSGYPGYGRAHLLPYI